MKKLLLSAALLASTMAIAKDYKYEITPVIGYNIAEGNLNLDDQFLVGAEFQLNTETYLVPELSILYTDTDYEDLTTNPSTDILRFALNGVHEFDAIGMFTPLAKVGVGYETMDKHLAENKDSVFVDAGIGAKMPITDNIALKMEAVYMLKNNDNRWDNNLALLAGINFAFGDTAQREAPAVAEVQEEPAPVKEEAAPVAQKDPVLAPTPPNDGDSDQDGVFNSVDKCPTTPLGNVVDADGCTAKINLHIKFENNSFIIDVPSQQRVAKFANFLKERANYTTEITGHTSSKGSANYNQVLSEKRANAVKELLMAYGIDGDRVSTVGKGETEPMAAGENEDAHYENRRIEATLTKH